MVIRFAIFAAVSISFAAVTTTAVDSAATAAATDTVRYKVSELPASEVQADYYNDNREFTEIKSEHWAGKNISLADLLAENSGIQTRRKGGMGSFQTVSIRGMQGNQIALAIDGVVVQNSSGNMVDLGSIDLNQYERVEIYKGFVPAKFGANVMGGVINLISKDATTRSGKFSASVGSYGTRILSMQAGAPINEIYWNSAINYRAATNDFPFFNRNGTAYNFEDDFWDTRRNADFSQISGNHIFRFVHSKRNSRLRIEHHTENGGIPGREEQQTKTANSKNDGALISYEIESSDDSWAWSARAFGGFEKNRNFWSPIDNIGLTSKVPTISGAITHNAGGLASLLGKGDFWNVELHTLLNYSILNSRNDHPALSSYEFSNKTGQISFLGDLSPISFFNLKVNANGRWSKDRTESGKISAVGIGGEFQDGFRFLPSGRVSFNLGEKNFPISAFGALSHYFRAPSLSELFSTGFGILPNPNLEAEQGEQAELGTAFTTKKTHISLTAFANRIRNRIIYMTSFGLSKPINSGSGRVYGVEAELSTDPFTWLKINSNATFQNAGDLPNEPEQQYNAGAIFKLPFNFELHLEGEAHSEIFRDKAQRMHIPPNAYYHAGLTYKPLPATTLSIFARNLGGEDYQNIYDAYPVPNRTMAVTYSQEF
ncbi:hypothetical protein AGMMS49938_10200 [Fibrobacterales bacterium]|nr:hypothetical protein AGMMS49938_10200 [Fibrobacterales bacterium]